MASQSFFGSKTKRGERITVFVLLPLVSILTIACVWFLVREAIKPAPREAAPTSLLPVSHAAAQPELEPAALLQKLAGAEALEKRGDFSAAEPVFAAITLSNPESDRGWGGLGRSLLAARKYREAAAALDQACRLNLMEAKHFAARGDARRATGDLKGAIRDYRDAVSLNPGNARTSNILLFIALETKVKRGDSYDTGLFERDLENVRRPNPGAEAGWVMALAVSEMRAGNSKESVELLRKASEILPQDQYQALLADRIFADQLSQDLIRKAAEPVPPVSP